MKTKKALLKRFKITKRGKVLRRRPGQDHFRAKESRKKQLRGKRLKSFRIKKKILGRYIQL